MGFDRDAYATRIKSLRKKSGLTQEQLAEKINVTSTYIVKITASEPDQLNFLLNWQNVLAFLLITFFLAKKSEIRSRSFKE